MVKDSLDNFSKMYSMDFDMKYFLIELIRKEITQMGQKMDKGITNGAIKSPMMDSGR